MKRYIQAMAAVLTAAVFAGCDGKENGEKKEIVFPDKQTVEIAPGDSKSVSFKADAEWSLVSSQTWCKFNDNGVVSQTISGPQGDATVEITVEKTDKFDAETAEIKMTMDGKSEVVIEVTRPGIERVLKLYVKDDNGAVTEAAKDASVAIEYGTYGAASRVMVGFKANFQWKVKSLPEGVTLSDQLSGSANEEESDMKFATLELSAEKTPYAFAEKQYMVVSDIEEANEYKFEVTYEGMGDNISLSHNRAMRFSEKGFLYVGNGMEQTPSETEKEFSFSVTAADMKYHATIVTYNEATGKGEIQTGADFWLKMTDDKKGNITLSVAENKDKERQAYFILFPASQDLANIDWSEYFEDTGWYQNRDAGFSVSQDAIPVEGGFIAQWGMSMEDVSGKLVKFQDYPLFKGMDPSSVFYSAPAENTYVFELTLDQVSGQLSFAPLGFPEELYPISLSRHADNKGNLPADFELTHASIYKPGGGPMGSTINGLGIDFSKIEAPATFAVLTYSSEEDMELFKPAFSALVIIVNENKQN